MGDINRRVQSHKKQFNLPVTLWISRSIYKICLRFTVSFLSLIAHLSVTVKLLVKFHFVILGEMWCPKFNATWVCCTQSSKYKKAFAWNILFFFFSVWLCAKCYLTWNTDRAELNIPMFSAGLLCYKEQPETSAALKARREKNTWHHVRSWHIPGKINST